MTLLQPLLPELLSSSSPNSNEKWLTACCISSCHSNLPHPSDKCFFSVAHTLPLSQYLASISSIHTPLLLQRWRKKRREKENLKTREHLRQLVLYAFLPTLHPRSPSSPTVFSHSCFSSSSWQWFTNYYRMVYCASCFHRGLSRSAGLYAYWLSVYVLRSHSPTLSLPPSLPSLSFFLHISASPVYFFILLLSKLLLWPLAIH